MRDQNQGGYSLRPWREGPWTEASLRSIRLNAKALCSNTSWADKTRLALSADMLSLRPQEQFYDLAPADGLARFSLVSHHQLPAKDTVPRLKLHLFWGILAVPCVALLCPGFSTDPHEINWAGAREVNCGT